MNDLADGYCGYKEIVVTQNEDVESLFSKDSSNTFGCVQNEYLIAKDENGEIIGTYKCVNGRLEKVPYKAIDGRFTGKVKARNTNQKLAIDMLYDRNTTIKVITGRFGTGKDFLMSAAALDLIEKNLFDKIIYVRNNIEVKDSKPIGFLPGSYNEKLMPFAMPLADHLGGESGLSMMMTRGIVDVVHLGFIRGRDFKNSIVMCSEAENMTKEHIKLLIGRIGEGSELWINGDYEQCDADVFKYNSGLIAAISKLKGHKRFGYVNLVKTERSETAAMADLID